MGTAKKAVERQSFREYRNLHGRWKEWTERVVEGQNSTARNWWQWHGTSDVNESQQRIAQHVFANFIGLQAATVFRSVVQASRQLHQMNSGTQVQNAA